MQSVGQLNATYRAERTFNGWSLDTARSVLQSSVRQNRLDTALFAVYEMDLFAFLKDPRSEGIRANLVHRLMGLYLEEVGIGNADLWPRIHSNLFGVLEARELRRGTTLSDPVFVEQRRKEVTMLTRVVHALCRSIHSHESTYYRHVFTPGRYERIPEADSEIERRFLTSVRHGLYEEPKETIDAVARFLGALESSSPSCIHWGLRIKTPLTVFSALRAYVNQKVDDAGRRQYLLERLDIALKWFRELTPARNDNLCWITMCLLIIRLNTRGITPDTVPTVDAERLSKRIKYNILGCVPSTDISNTLTNEDARSYQPFKDAYMESINPPVKKVEVVKEEIPTEKDAVWPDKESELDVVARVQLPTTKYHTDTFLIRFAGEMLFVKGPYLTTDVPVLVTELTDLKEKIGLPHAACQTVWMVPDKLQSDGLRCRCKPGRKYPYLIFESLITDNPVPLNDVGMVEWELVKSCMRPDLSDKVQLRSFVQSLLFRAVLDLGDNALRNFLWVPRLESVVSVDEEVVGGFKHQLSKNDAKRVRKEVERHPKVYDTILHEIASHLSEDASQKLPDSAAKVLGL